MVFAFVNKVCEILEIETPQVSFDVSMFHTQTTLAQCSSDAKMIYIRESDTTSLDTLFAIAHELRHVWQIQTDHTTFFNKYKPASELDIESYNQQLPELDANAFATFIMEDGFGVRPLFNGLSDDLRNEIFERAAQISKELAP